jgi:hypothetical protein
MTFAGVKSALSRKLFKLNIIGPVKKLWKARAKHVNVFGGISTLMLKSVLCIVFRQNISEENLWTKCGNQAPSVS